MLLKPGQHQSPYCGSARCWLRVLAIEFWLLKCHLYWPFSLCYSTAFSSWELYNWSIFDLVRLCRRDCKFQISLYSSAGAEARENLLLGRTALASNPAVGLGYMLNTSQRVLCCMEDCWWTQGRPRDRYLLLPQHKIFFPMFCCTKEYLGLFK